MARRTKTLPGIIPLRRMRRTISKGTSPFGKVSKSSRPIPLFYLNYIFLFFWHLRNKTYKKKIKQSIWRRSSFSSTLSIGSDRIALGDYLKRRLPGNKHKNIDPSWPTRHLSLVEWHSAPDGPDREVEASEDGRSDSMQPCSSPVRPSHSMRRAFRCSNRKMHENEQWDEVAHILWMPKEEEEEAVVSVAQCVWNAPEE